MMDFLFCFVCLWIHMISVEAGVYRVGEDIRLNCVITNVTAYYWSKKRPDPSSIYDFLQHIQGPFKGFLTKTLTIRNAQYKDSGMYRCKFRLTRNSTIDSDNPIEVIVSDPPYVSIPKDTYFAARNGPVTLECSVKDVTEVVWYRKTASFTTEYKYSPATVIDPSLTIRNVIEGDDGRYSCVGSSSLGTTNDTTTLTSGDPPRVSMPSSTSASLGSTVHLNCSVSGVDVVEWYKIDQNNYHKRIYSNWPRYGGGTRQNPGLTISNVRTDDDAVYKCTGSNKFGKASADTRLSVGNPPSVLIPNQTYYGKIGHSVNIPCTVHNADFGKWYRVGASGRKEIKASLKYSIAHLPHLNLTINNLQSSDTGDYKCSGGNSFEEKSDYATLVTGVRPQIKAGMTKIEVEVGRQTVLEVSVNASNQINRVSWLHDNRKLNGERFLNGNPGEPSLTITNIQPTDDGIYTCYVDNGIGTSSVNISVVTWQSPSIVLTGNKFVPIGSTITIQGSIKAKPEAVKIVWKKRIESETQVIDINNDSKYSSTWSPGNLIKLTIEDSLKIDSSTYICEAHNKYGSGEGEIDITVGEVTKANIPKDYYVVIKGDNITMECMFGDKPTSLFWRNQNNIYSTDQRYWFKYSGGTIASPALTVKNVQPGDAGTYTCSLTNNFGDSDDTTELKVLDAYIRSSSIQTQANKEETLPCYASGGSNLVWRRNGVAIDISNDEVYRGGTLDIHALTIKNVTRYHAGNYTCETSYDTVTAVSNDLVVLVEDKPLVKQPAQSVQGLPGGTITLPCTHESFPKATKLYWTKDGKVLDEENSKYNRSTISHPELIIYRAESMDDGEYICCVENQLGTGCGQNIVLIVKGANSQSIGPAVGGAFGALSLLVILGVAIVLCKRKRNTVGKSKNLKNGDPLVKYNTRGSADQSDGTLYVNMNTKSSSIEDNDNVNSQQTEGQETDDSTYYNTTEVTTRIGVTELRKYTEQQQLSDELQKQYKDIPYGKQHPATHAQMRENVAKNRFKTTLSYDQSRVVLRDGPGYINANYIDGFEKEKCYIATQGPLPNTLNDFWKMVWQKNVNKIIMLTNLIETMKEKCTQYWPSGGKPMKCDEWVLTLQAEKERAAYVTREIEIVHAKTKEKRKVHQFHFTAWPDHGTPDPLYLVLFHRHVLKESSAKDVGPLLVHCSAGIGRTGTYIGLDALYKEGLATGYVDVVKYVKTMRNGRMNMVQTADQFVCLHQTLSEIFTMKDTNISKDNFQKVWSDIKSDKEPKNKDRVHEEYQILQKKIAGHSFEYTAASSPENKNKNRNAKVLASDKHRLYLTRYDKGRNDYINAVQAPSYKKFVGYISTQLPLPNTKVDFWTMISDHESSTIVLLLDKSKDAEMVYSKQGETFTCGPFKIESIKSKVAEQADGNLDVKRFMLSRQGEEARQITIFQAVYKGLPEPSILCRFVELLSTRIDMSNEPVTIVSRDGAKHCGLFCAFMNAVSSLTIDGSVDIFQLVQLLQIRRPEFFQDLDEYRMCYEAINHYVESSNVYANV